MSSPLQIPRKRSCKLIPGSNRFAYKFRILKMDIWQDELIQDAWILAPTITLAKKWIVDLCLEPGEQFLDYNLLERITLAEYYKSYGVDGENELTYRLPY